MAERNNSSSKTAFEYSRKNGADTFLLQFKIALAELLAKDIPLHFIQINLSEGTLRHLGELKAGDGRPRNFVSSYRDQISILGLSVNIVSMNGSKVSLEDTRSYQ